MKLFFPLVLLGAAIIAYKSFMSHQTSVSGMGNQGGTTSTNAAGSPGWGGAFS